MSWLDSLPPTLLDCRQYGHRWEVGPIARLPYGLIGQSLACSRCSTERLDVFIRKTGQLEFRNYHYVDGYRKPPDVDRPTVDEVRTVTLAHRDQVEDLGESWADPLERVKQRTKEARASARAS